MTHTTSRTKITFKEFEVTPEIELSQNMIKVLLFLKDKITKFSDITEWLSSGGEFNYLILENRPGFSFVELTDDERFKLHFELIKIKQKLDNLPEYIDVQEKEWRKQFMPKINIILTGKRSCPPIKEIIDILGLQETELRIDRGMAYLDTLIYPQIARIY